MSERGEQGRIGGIHIKLAEKNLSSCYGCLSSCRHSVCSDKPFLKTEDDGGRTCLLRTPPMKTVSIQVS